jgi:hypothetical protein
MVEGPFAVGTFDPRRLEQAGRRLGWHFTVTLFWAFQIPDRLCEKYGYPKLTPEIKRKIVSGNAARVYGVDLDALRTAAATDDLSWTNDVLGAHGTR